MWQPIKTIADRLSQRDMEPLGIANTMRLAKTFNRFRYGKYHRTRVQSYRGEFDKLLAEHANGSGTPTTVGKMKDGWLIDTSRSWPHLDKLIEEAEVVVSERGGKPPAPRAKPFIMDIAKRDDADRFPSFLNFALSPQVLKIVSDYLGFVPVLSTTMPPGYRLTESSTRFDPGAGGPYRESQLYHLDHHDTPLVYVIVLLRDVTIESGPFTFLPISTSEKAACALNYRQRGAPYRVTDEHMYSVVPKEEAITFMYPKGSVLFMDSSRCFHYGSRDCAVPRYQMMYAFVSPCRTDFSEVLMTPIRYKTQAGDSRLRKMVLNNEHAPR